MQEGLDDGLDERLDEWLESLGPVVARLDWFTVGVEGFAHDFSAASLGALEAVLAQQSPPDDLIESAVAYLGEALLCVGGGRWDRDRDPDSDLYDQPMIRFDAALGLPPLVPQQLIIDARRAGTGTEFSAAYARLGAAVAAYQGSHPGWTPTKELTAGLDEADPAQLPTHEWLSAWLAEREAAFTGWAADCGEAGPWDFSPESIDRLGELTLRRFATLEQFKASENRDFVDGAAWYLGEAVRRSSSGVSWQYEPVPPEYPDAAAYYAQTGDPWAGSPYLARYPETGMSDPRSMLKLAVIRRGPEKSLRERVAESW